MADQTLGRQSLDPSVCIDESVFRQKVSEIFVSMGSPGPALPGDIITNNAYITEIAGDTWIVTPNPADPQNPIQVINLDAISVAAGYTTIQDEGVGLTQRTILNFIGASVTAADDAGNTRTNVTINAAGAEVFGILKEDVPACTVDYSGITSTIEAGITAAAVYPMFKDLDDLEQNDILRASALVYAVNFIWPTIIKAGTTTNADKPVVVRGYIDSAFLVNEVEVEAFIITNVIYPVTIMSGVNQGAVSGTGNFTADGLALKWGREPGVSSLSVANPYGFAGPDNGWNLIMQLTDGTWQVIDMECIPV